MKELKDQDLNSGKRDIFFEDSLSDPRTNSKQENTNKKIPTVIN
jgi:hypothetical protein